MVSVNIFLFNNIPIISPLYQIIELNWTQGFIPVAKGDLNYSDGTTLNPIHQPLSWNGSYLSLNTVFLFHPKNWKYLPKGKGKLERVIFNPRYI